MKAIIKERDIGDLSSMAGKKDIIYSGENPAQRLDFALKGKETKGTKAKMYYELNDRRYYNYIDNKTWKEFVAEMKSKYPSAYQAYCDGSGNELKEYNTKYGRRPPKMASYGSSSRMIYLLSREKNGFCFEKQLPTTVGGTANLDGYLYSNSTHYYVEAKRREPYSSKSHIINRKYENLYRYFDEDGSLDFHCKIRASAKDDEMKVVFSAKGKEIINFDIKQMISHLLGIATEHLNNPTEENIHFIYLLYNPNEIEGYIDNSKHFKKICSIYKSVKAECKSISFEPLFKAILLKLHSCGVGKSTIDEIEQMAGNFSFDLYDQESYVKLLNDIS